MRKEENIIVSAETKGFYEPHLSVCSPSWVVFEEPGFCGEAYILERGLYGCPEDWGALQPRLGSAMPVVLVRVLLLWWRAVLIGLCYNISCSIPVAGTGSFKLHHITCNFRIL